MSVHAPRGGALPDRAPELIDRVTERVALDRLLEAVRVGESQALVVRGEPGVGKTVLLEYLAGRAADTGCQVARAAGVQSEMELAFAGLHQLCVPLLDHAERLPGPQRDALRTAFGLAAGPPPDRFFVGLAVLSLLSGVAGERPLICLIDDEQWLDQASAQALGFVARRLAADPVGIVFAARGPGAELAGLPELEVSGLREEDARALLEGALATPLDEQVRDLIIAETHGNPLALLELPRGLSMAELAGGFGLPAAVRWPAGSRTATAASWTPCRTRPGSWCSWRRPTRPVSSTWSGARPGGWASRFRRRGPPRRRGWWSSAPRCGSGIRWRARRPTGRHRSPTGGRCTGRWPR